MNLKDFLANREKPPELYWSLVIERGWVQAGIWYISDNAAEIVNISPGAAWKEDSELVTACDAALSSSITALPDDYVEPNKTVFGVPARWVKNGEISDEFIGQIKEVCTELSLTPVGFVVLPEAIANLYKSEEGAHLSSIIVGLDSESLEISVFKLGNLVGTTTVARSVSLIEDVVEGLTRFEEASPLPSRIIIYDGRGSELEDAKEELIKADWEDSGKIKFLHTPKAEILSSDRKVLATSLAGANEIGHVGKVNLNSEEQILEEETPLTQEVQNIKVPDEVVTAEDLGFTSNDIPQIEKQINNLDFKQNVPAPVVTSEIMVPKKGMYLQKTKNLFHDFSSKIKIKYPSSHSGGSKNKIYLVVAVILLLVFGAGAYLWLVPKAVVTVFVSPKTFQEQVNVAFNLEGQFDESRAIIPGVAITASANGDKTKSTTGTKLVGEKAKGSVQIANGNGNPINLSAGTVLTSTSGLKFVTSSEASVSGQLIPGSPGTATLSVVANDLGAQYNLAKGEVFKVGLFEKSLVAATSQTDFSGGSSQQIAAVSADDQKKLELDLKNELSSKLLNDLNSKVDSDQVFVNDLSSQTITSETFDHKVGEVADTLKLTLVVSGNGVAADKEKLLQYVTNSLKSKIPDGYALRSSQISFKFTFAGKQNGNLSYNVDINANFLPLIKTDDIVKQISGKKVSDVEAILSNIQGNPRAEIKLNPSLPGPFKVLPYVNKNIKIEIAAEE